MKSQARLRLFSPPTPTIKKTAQKLLLFFSFSVFFLDRLVMRCVCKSVSERNREGEREKESEKTDEIGRTQNGKRRI